MLILVASLVVGNSAQFVISHCEVRLQRGPGERVLRPGGLDTLADALAGLMLELSRVFPQAEVRGLQIQDLLLERRFVLLSLVRHWAHLLRRSWLLKAQIVGEVGLDVVFEVTLPEVFAVVGRGLRLVLFQVSRGVDGVGLAHVEVRFGETQLLRGDLCLVGGLNAVNWLVDAQRVRLVKQHALVG